MFNSFLFRRFLFVFVAAFVCSSGVCLKAEPEGGDTKSFVAFLEAVRLGDVATVRRLIAGGVNINQGDEGDFHYPALAHAFDAHQLDVARVLVEAGADLNKVMDDSYPLSWAACAGDADLVRLMIKKGADPRRRFVDEAMDFRANSPIENALEWGRLDVVKVLEAAGASWMGGDRGAHALSCAIKSGSVDCAAYLISKGADVNAPFEGNLPLEVVAERGDVALMKLFLAKGAQVNAISTGSIGLSDWRRCRRTALVGAMVYSRLEAVRVLLQNGADPGAMDNLAIKWADLLGDYEAFDLLRKAGAPDPGLFPYRGWVDWKEEMRRASTSSAATDGGVAERGAALTLQVAVRPAGKAVSLARQTKFAVITQRDGLADAESLLAAKLSALDKAVVLERSELRAILKERALDKNFGDSPVENARVGKLLGADALVIVRSYPLGGQKTIEARLVSVSTGLVTAAVSSALSPAQMDAWSTQVAGRCAADDELLFTSPAKATLVAVTPFTASVNTAAGRKWERELETLAMLRLSRLPGVFLVERAMLDRLQAEGRPEDKALLDGSWLVSGSVELSQNGGGASLRLSLNPGGGGAEQVVAVTEAASPLQLMDGAMPRAAAILKTTEAKVRSPEEEAAAFLVQADGFFARKMWEQAEQAADAAWVLGLHDDRVVRIRLEAATQRVMFSSRFYAKAKHDAYELRGLASVLCYRAPLLLPREDERELTLEYYIEQANRILDMLELVLPRKDEKIAGVPYRKWLCGLEWDAATAPLKVAEALSYRHDYGDELDALRARLLDLNTRALRAARERGDAEMLDGLMVLRCKNLPWWVKGDDTFQEQVLGLLHGAENSPPPYSEHAVWGPVFMIAKERVRLMAGRASSSWSRLARAMAQSQDVRERYFGSALCAIANNGAERIDGAIQAAMRDFPALVELDNSVAGYGRKPLDGYGESRLVFSCWYADVLHDLLEAKLTLMTQGPGGAVGNSAGAWTPVKNGSTRIQPELLRFYVAQCVRRLELIAKRGASGFFFPLGGRGSGLTGEQLSRLLAACGPATEALAPLLKDYPGLKAPYRGLLNEHYELEYRLKLVAAEKHDPAQGLSLNHPRLLFEKMFSTLSAEDRKAEGSPSRESMLRDAAGRWWFTGRTAHRSVFYTYGPDGGTQNETWTDLPRQPSGDYIQMRGMQLGCAGMTDRYFVCAGFGGQVNEDSWTNGLVVYDRVAGKWSLLAPKHPFDPNHGILDTKVFGNRLFYTFIDNPVLNQLDRTGVYSYEKQGDPLRGVMAYDFKSGAYTLLASNRRNPPLSPIDRPSARYERFIHISDDEFAVEGSEGQIYDARTGTWRARTPADVKKAVSDRFPPYNRCRVGGYTWELHFDNEKHALRCLRLERPMIEFLIPVTFDDTGLASRLAPFPDCRDAYARVKAREWVDFGMIPEGTLFSFGPVYYWLPMNDLTAAIMRMMPSPDALKKKTAR